MATEEQVKTLIEALTRIENTLRKVSKVWTQLEPLTDEQRKCIYDAAEEVQNQAVMLAEDLEP